MGIYDRPGYEFQNTFSAVIFLYLYDMIKKIGWILFLSLMFLVQVHGQKVALKTNALYWATATPNLGIEVALSKKMTLDISGGYNPFTFKDNLKWKHYLIEPELRYWLCESFNGHFFGLHTGFSEYNMSRVPMLYNWDKSQKYRYEGWLTGVGLSYGYQWILGNHWNLEASIGFGFVHTSYKKYDCVECGDYYGEYKENFFAPTKATISIIYLIK